jgi:hypothetical protein
MNTDQVLSHLEQIIDPLKAQAYCISSISTRVQWYQQRMTEMNMFCEKYGAIYDESMGELLFQSEKSQRAFVFKIDPIYPFGGLFGAKVVGIEPLQHNESLKDWNHKLQTIGADRLDDIVSILV